LKRSPLVILGAGSTLRGDDGWAYYFLEKLKGVVSPRIFLLWGETTPENLLRSIEKIKPQEVLILDAGEFPASPGEFQIFSPDELPPEPLFSHRFPLKILAEEISRRVSAEVHFLLLKPEQIELGMGLSPNVQSAIEKLFHLFSSLFLRPKPS
jgi:hydrogenase maturation protease